MTDPRKKAKQGLQLLKEENLEILREAYPDALQASEIHDGLGHSGPGKRFD